MIKKLIVILSILIPFVSFGQGGDIDFSLTTDQNKVMIGTPIQVNLRFVYPSTFEENRIGFPVITDSTDLGEHFEIWNINPPQKNIQEDNLGNVNVAFEQEFTVASFDSGRFDLGPIPALIGADTIMSNVASIIVLPMAVDTTQDFKDIKQLSEDPLSAWEKFVMWFKDNWYWPIAILAAIIGTIIYLRWRKRRPEEKEIIPNVPLSIRLLEQLDKIERKEYWQNNKEKLYYSEITDVLRKYLENRYKVHTFEKTSREILSNLKMKSISKDHFILLEKLFGLSDMVKFAKSLPTPQENEEAMNIAKRIILETRIDLDQENNTTKEE